MISSRWKVLILRDLLQGTRRFGELRKSVDPVAQKVLTARLRAIEQGGLLTRKVYAEVPPRAEYTLTELGCSLHPILDSMACWAALISKTMPIRLHEKGLFPREGTFILGRMPQQILPVYRGGERDLPSVRRGGNLPFFLEHVSGF